MDYIVHNDYMVMCACPTCNSHNVQDAMEITRLAYLHTKNG